MRLIKGFLFLIICIAGLVLSGCNKNDTADNIVLTVTPANMVVAPGGFASYTIFGSSKAPLVVLNAIPTYNGVRVPTIDTPFLISQYYYSFIWNLPVSASAENLETGSFTWTLSDKNGQTATQTTTFTVKTVSVKDSVVLSNQNFYATDSQLIYTAMNAAKADSFIDFVFYTDTISGIVVYNIAAPADPSVQASGKWTVRNTTSFKVLPGSAINFAGLNAPIIENLYNGSSAKPGTIITNLASNEFIVFLTAAGKYGVIQVVSISAASGYILTMNIMAEK